MQTPAHLEPPAFRYGIELINALEDAALKGFPISLHLSCGTVTGNIVGIGEDQVMLASDDSLLHSHVPFHAIHSYAINHAHSYGIGPYIPIRSFREMMTLLHKNTLFVGIKTRSGQVAKGRVFEVTDRNLVLKTAKEITQIIPFIVIDHYIYVLQADKLGQSYFPQSGASFLRTKYAKRRFFF